MPYLWKKVQDEMVDEKNINKKSINIILVPSQRYQDSRHLLQNPKVPRNVMGFSNRAQRFTGSNYLDVDSPLKSCSRQVGAVKVTWPGEHVNSYQNLLWTEHNLIFTFFVFSFQSCISPDSSFSWSVTNIFDTPTDKDSNILGGEEDTCRYGGVGPWGGTGQHQSCKKCKSQGPPDAQNIQAI